MIAWIRGVARASDPLPLQKKKALFNRIDININPRYRTIGRGLAFLDGMNRESQSAVVAGKMQQNVLLKEGHSRASMITQTR